MKTFSQEYTYLFKLFFFYTSDFYFILYYFLKQLITLNLSNLVLFLSLCLTLTSYNQVIHLTCFLFFCFFDYQAIVRVKHLKENPSAF